MRDVIYELWRNGTLESYHTGRYAVVEGRKVVDRKGDIDAVTWLRSSAKPFQATGALGTGMAERWGLVDREVALMCGSHHGDDIHVRTAASILRKAGLRPSHLRCGTHPPISRTAQAALARARREPTVLHHNCSGKHSGMVAAARHLGAPLATYLDPDHALQRRNLAVVARHAGLKPSQVRIGIDGCSAPVFGVPIARAARMFASISLAEPGSPEARVLRAMTSHPEMVGHPCEELMRAGRGALIGKIGAEGVYGLALVGRGIGIAVKIADGNSRALAAVIGAILRRLRVLPAAALKEIDRLATPVIRNYAGLEVGKTVVRLGGRRG